MKFCVLFTCGYFRKLTDKQRKSKEGYPVDLPLLLRVLLVKEAQKTLGGILSQVIGLFQKLPVEKGHHQQNSKRMSSNAVLAEILLVGKGHLLLKSKEILSNENLVLNWLELRERILLYL